MSRFYLTEILFTNKSQRLLIVAAIQEREKRLHFHTTKNMKLDNLRTVYFSAFK